MAQEPIVLGKTYQWEGQLVRVTAIRLRLPMNGTQVITVERDDGVSQDVEAQELGAPMPTLQACLTLAAVIGWKNLRARLTVLREALPYTAATIRAAL